MFHCGALVSDWATTDEIAGVNVGGTRNLLDASIAASVTRFIHFSSTDVYGYPGGTGVGETHRCDRFANWYAQTKLDSEAEVQRATQAHALEAVILRPSTVYGPGSTDVVGDIARAIKGGHMLLVDRGRAIAGLCYVDNLVDAAVLAMRHERPPGRRSTSPTASTSPGSSSPTVSPPGSAARRSAGASPTGWPTDRLLARARLPALRRATHVTSPPLLSRQAVQVLGRNQDFSNRKARELLGWEPRVGYDAGLAATVQWLRSEHL